MGETAEEREYIQWAGLGAPREESLTFHVQDDPLRDGGWHPVGGYAQVSAHLVARDFGQLEDVSVVDHHLLLLVHRDALAVLAAPDDFGCGKACGISIWMSGWD